MTFGDVVAIAAGALVTGLLWLFFFGPKRSQRAELRGGVQEVEVTVRGGYSPDLIRAHPGVPLRLVFDRQESGDCPSRVLFPDFGVSASLPAFARTAVELVPDRPGEFGFACGMNMVHGTLLVEDADESSISASSAKEPFVAAPPPAVPEVTEAEFALEGMSCASCVSRIESAIRAVPGVDHVAVNFGAERASVAFDARRVSPADVIAAVEAIGYHAR